MELAEIKQCELGILEEVAAFCDKNGLTYFLDSGTLLGAIRHQGFIPWDDDIDICMPRKDYERFLKMFGTQGHFRLLDHSTIPDCYYAFAKVVDMDTTVKEQGVRNLPELGVWVDIFPLDGLPDGEAERAKFQKKIWAYTRLLAYSVADREEQPCDIKHRIRWLAGKALGWKWIRRRLVTLASQYDMYKTKYALDNVCMSQKEQKCPSKAFFHAVDVSFEGKTFKAPEGYDDYLKCLYGDYMQLPPVEERVIKHPMVACRKG
jgi:lipopolysaccharide cholinephosphotransferase